MADFVFNVALGRTVEWYNNVDTNSPANSAFVLLVLASAGLESDAVLRDKDTFADLVSGTTNEVTNVGYARKVLTDADFAALTVDDTNNRIDLDFADQLFTGIGAGDLWAKVVIGYDSDTTAGTDANIVPMLAYDITVTPNGGNITLALNAAGFFRAVSNT